MVDASVLIHALYQVKKWCRDGRRKIVIIPLEGTIPIVFTTDIIVSEKARSASRIPEAPVETNPRIRVQRDDAFLLGTRYTNPQDVWFESTFQEILKASDRRSFEANATPKNDEPKPHKVVLVVLSLAPNLSSIRFPEAC